MTRIEVSHTSSASPEAVWEVMTDIENAAEVIDAIRSVERLDAGTSFGVGTRWREKRVLFGKAAVEELRVTSVEPGQSYTVVATNAGTTYTSTLTVTADQDGSEITMLFEANPEHAMAKVLGATVGRLFEGATRHSLERDLADIAAAAESQSQ